MSLTTRIAHNVIVQLIGKGAAVLFGVVTIGMLTRYLGQSGFGAYTTSVTFAQFFGTLADMGLYIVSVKKISEVHADVDRVFNNILTLRIVSALVFVFAAPLVVLLFPYPTPVKIGVAIVSLMNLFVSLTQVFNGIYQRALAMFRASLAEVISKAVFLGLIAFFIFGHYSLLWLLFAVMASSAVQCLLTIYWARGLVRLRLRYDRDFWLEVLRESWPVALSVALNLIYFRADTIILSLFYPQATVGVYGASYKILEVLVALPAMFAGLIIPLVSLHLSRNDHGQFQATFQRGFDFLLTLALPLVAGVFMLAHPIMAFIAGPEFTESGSILRVLIFAVGSIFVGSMSGNTVVSLSKQKEMMRYYLGVAIFALLGYFIFIPRFSVWGASGMTVATEFAIMVSSLIVVTRASGLRLKFVQARKSLGAALIMVVALLFARHLPLLLAVVLGVAVYGAALALLGGIQRQTLREMLRRA